MDVHRRLFLSGFSFFCETLTMMSFIMASCLIHTGSFLIVHCVYIHMLKNAVTVKSNTISSITFQIKHTCTPNQNWLSYHLHNFS